MNAIELANVSKIYRRYGGRHFATLKSALLQRSILRDLQPSEDRVSLDVRRTGLGQVSGVIEEMGQLMAWAHLRSSGRQGSAIADELIDFGTSARSWRRDLLDAAHQCAAQVENDWKAYCQAHDAGKMA